MSHTLLKTNRPPSATKTSTLPTPPPPFFNSIQSRAASRLRTVGLLPRDALDVDHELAAVARLDLALAVLVRAPDHHHLVSLPDRERSDLKSTQNNKYK